MQHFSAKCCILLYISTFSPISKPSIHNPNCKISRKFTRSCTSYPAHPTVPGIAAVTDIFGALCTVPTTHPYISIGFIPFMCYNLEKPESVLLKMEMLESVFPKMDRLESILPKMEMLESVFPEADRLESILPKMEMLESVLPKADRLESVLPKADRLESVFSESRKVRNGSP